MSMDSSRTVLVSILLCTLSLISRVDLASILPAHLVLKSENNEVNGVNRPKGKYSQAGMRPSPSDDLPIVPLQYPHAANMPSESDLDPMKLQRILGKEYDTAFMSHVTPLDFLLNPNGTYMYNFKKSQPIGQLPPEIRQLSFTLPGRDKKIKVKSRQNRRRIQRYLSTYSYCPVHYTWNDLGQMFWPRWIREGDCRSERSCSIPAGMSCKAEQSTTKTVLYWHCRINRKQTQCRWIPIKYPIIIKCGCRC